MLPKLTPTLEAGDAVRVNRPGSCWHDRDAIIDSKEWGLWTFQYRVVIDGQEPGSYFAASELEPVGQTMAAKAAAEDVKSEHPMQPVVIDEYGTHRFKANAIVRFLLEGGLLNGMNRLATLPFTAEDRMQLAQLVGYSVSGYGDLPYVTDESANRALGLSEALKGGHDK